MTEKLCDRGNRAGDVEDEPHHRVLFDVVDVELQPNDPSDKPMGFGGGGKGRFCSNKPNDPSGKPMGFGEAHAVGGKGVWRTSFVISGGQLKRTGTSAETPRLTCMIVGGAWKRPEE